MIGGELLHCLQRVRRDKEIHSVADNRLITYDKRLDTDRNQILDVEVTVVARSLDCHKNRAGRIRNRTTVGYHIGNHSRAVTNELCASDFGYFFEKILHLIN